MSIRTNCPQIKSNAVISDELIREVETRMNRNYLPPALKLHSSNNAGPHSHSPPTVGPCPATNTSAMLTARRYGPRACKLPTVQEVGKLLSTFFLVCFIPLVLVFNSVRTFWFFSIFD